MEIWKDIKGFEGSYQISSLGRVKSLDRTVVYKDGRTHIHKGQIMTGSDNGKGYKTIDLYTGNKRTKKLIHRLVAETFIDNPLNKNEIDHIDTDKTNNRVENLRWVTHTENKLNPITRELTSKINSIPVIQLSLKGKTLKYFDSAKIASEQTGINHSNINLNCNNKYKSAGGYRWVKFDDFCDLY